MDNIDQELASIEMDLRMYAKIHELYNVDFSDKVRAHLVRRELLRSCRDLRQTQAIF